MPESTPFGPESQDNTDDKLTPKKRRGGTALSRYLFQRREQEANLNMSSSIESDDDEETEEKPKRFRKLFSRIFPGMVEKSEIPDTKKERQFDLEAFLGLKKPTEAEENQSEEVETLSEYSQESVDAGIHDDSEPLDVPLRPQRRTSSSNSTNTGSAPPNPSVTPNPNTVPPQPSGPNVVPPQPPNPPSLGGPGNPNIPPLGPNLNSGGNIPPFSPNAMPPNPNIQPQQVIERERVIDRRGSALPYVLIGAEYFARKRADRKLEQRTETKITNSNKAVERGAQAQRELQEIVAQNRQQIESLKQARENQERQRPNQVNKTPEIIASKPIQPEKMPIQRPERVISDEAVQRKIFEQVAEAAEHDVPVERVFERSHEVKDDKSVPVGAASVGSVMASKHSVDQSSARYQSSALTSAHLPSGGLPVITDQPDSNAYRQAMKAGFWAGTMIIILGSIAYLMLK